MVPCLEDFHVTEEDLGPAMRACNERQRLFVLAMKYFGGSQKKCAIAAGYAEESASVTGHHLAHHPKVQGAMLEVGKELLGTGTILTAKLLIDVISGDEQAEVKDRLKAAEMLMNRTGMHAMSEHKSVVVHRSESVDEQIKRLTDMAGKLGIDPQKLLGGIVVEADYEEVPAAPERSEGGKPGEDDLSDIYG